MCALEVVEINAITYFNRPPIQILQVVICWITRFFKFLKLDYSTTNDKFMNSMCVCKFHQPRDTITQRHILKLTLSRFATHCLF